MCTVKKRRCLMLLESWVKVYRNFFSSTKIIPIHSAQLFCPSEINVLFTKS